MNPVRIPPTELAASLHLGGGKPQLLSPYSCGAEGPTICLLAGNRYILLLYSVNMVQPGDSAIRLIMTLPIYEEI
jgi:hypothetical protein